MNGRYEVSNLGRIRNKSTQHILHQYENRFGYYILQLRPLPKVQKTVRVHSMVAEAFIGERPDGHVINHKDGDKKNNTPENLEYVTSSENNIHALKNGLRHPAKMSLYAPHGEQHYKAKISNDIARKVREIRENYGYGARRIAKMLGISRGIVSGILYRNTWKSKEINNYGT